MNACSQSHDGLHGERGVTMVFVAIAMVAIIAMAALSIDLVTLYLAREETQRTADAAALGAARVLSLSGVTGDPQNATGYWPAACTAAAQVAQAVASQNAVSNAAATSVNVNFLYNGTAVANCSFTGANAFGVNPQVQVQVVRGGLPTFFSRIWSRNPNSVSATATAEVLIRQVQERSLRVESSRLIRVVSNRGLCRIAIPEMREPHSLA